MFKMFLSTCLALLCICHAQGQVASDKYPWKKLSPGAALFLEHPEDVLLFPLDEERKIPVLLQLSVGTDTLETLRGKAFSAFGNIISVRLNHRDLEKVIAEDAVEWVEVAFRLNRVKMLNDTARVMSHVNEVQMGIANGLPLNYTGQGVVVGIVDIGFQPDNPNFLNGDGSVLRIKRFWHQNVKNGQPPSAFGYGTEYSALSDILNARDDDGTHGTHVAGIAAGSGFTTPALKYRGMAPDADMVFVAIKYGNDTLAGSAYGDYVVANPAILDGFKYVFDYAHAVGKPAVCNLSWGMHTGPHDGSSLFDKAVENLTGPGKIVVGAAGNEAANLIHVGKELFGDTAYTFAIDRSRNDFKHESIYLDAWGDSAGTLGLNIAVLDTFGNLLLETPFYYASGGNKYRLLQTNGTDSLWFTLAVNPSYVNNKKPEILLMAETNHAAKQRIRIGFTASKGFHAWNSGQVYRWTSGGFLDQVKGSNFQGIYLNGTQSQCVGENGGTGKATISVGSYIARNHWVDVTGQYRAQNWLQPGDVSNFSSRGNTVDGRLKPDISAPGQFVASSVNYRTFPGWMLENTTFKDSFNGNEQYWTLLSGTSMAAPHVAGIVALMLQVNPQLDPSQVRDVLKQTATHDTFTGKDSNIHFGYGKVNAYEAVKLLVKLHVQELGVQQTVVVFPNPATAEVSFIANSLSNKAVEFTLWSLTGELCYRNTLHSDALGYAKSSLPNMAQGVYAYKLKSGNSVLSGKLIIRH